MDSWEDWFEEVISYAETERQEELIRRGYFMYENYFEQGMTPHEAFQEEWG
ncbi:hypothetical protein CNR37_00133 [Pseudomonas phage ventosus]|uniref:Uncharacterized protein n=1 Tax=Pseudomonas phage ventosus TaxID=2048980 RepID=A0A2H4P8G9_9CAUD|nr:hypothetical protein CNR37_00133 [Pseudomonas phage ventosus]